MKRVTEPAAGGSGLEAIVLWVGKRWVLMAGGGWGRGIYSPNPLSHELSSLTLTFGRDSVAVCFNGRHLGFAAR